MIRFLCNLINADVSTYINISGLENSYYVRCHDESKGRFVQTMHVS